MEDPEGALSFDFEGGLDAAAPSATATAPSAATEPPEPSAAAAAAPGVGGPQGPAPRRGFRQTVCRHWLRSLCMKGDACGFLHQYDKSRMPVCRFFRLYGECREQDCVYKHTLLDEGKECNMYKMGFCPNGPDCRYRHAKLPGPPPPVEEVFQKIQHLSSFNYGSSNKFFQHRNNNYTQQTEKPSQVSSIVNHATVVKPSSALEPPNAQQPQPENQQPQQQPSQNQVQNISNGLPNQANRTAEPLPQGQSRCVWSF